MYYNIILIAIKYYRVLEKSVFVSDCGLYRKLAFSNPLIKQQYFF